MKRVLSADVETAEQGGDSSTTRFPLLRRYAWASFISVVLASLIISGAEYRFELEEHVKFSKLENTHWSQVLLNELWEWYSPLLTPNSLDETRREAAVEALAVEVDARIASTGVKKVRIYDHAGAIVFSTERHEIGQDHSAHSDTKAFGLPSWSR